MQPQLRHEQRVHRVGVDVWAMGGGLLRPEVVTAPHDRHPPRERRLFASPPAAVRRVPQVDRDFIVDFMIESSYRQQRALRVTHAVDQRILRYVTVDTGGSGRERGAERYANGALKRSVERFC